MRIARILAGYSLVKPYPAAPAMGKKKVAECRNTVGAIQFVRCHDPEW